MRPNARQARWTGWSAVLLATLLAVLGCQAPPAPPPGPGPHPVKAAFAGGNTDASKATLTATWDGVAAYPDAGVPMVMVGTQAMANVTVAVTGSWSGTLVFESTADNSVWYSAPAVPLGGGAEVSSVTSDGQWVWTVSGAQQFRVRCSALGDAGAPATVALSTSVAGGTVFVAGGAITAVTPDGGLAVVAQPPISPSQYFDAGTVLTGDSGNTWLLGTAYQIPAGVKALTWVVSYSGGGSTSQLSYRLRIGHSSGTMGVTRIRNSAPTISGSTANQAEYKNTVTLTETGTTTVVVPVPLDVSGGIAYAALDLQEAVVDPHDAGVASATLAGSY